MIQESRCIYQNKLNKTCFQHDKAYEDFTDLTRRAASDKILPDKAFDVAKNPKNDVCKKSITSMVYKFFDKKNSGSGIKNKNSSNTS